MLDSIIKTAENRGNQLAGSQDKEQTNNPTQAPVSAQSSPSAGDNFPIQVRKQNAHPTHTCFAIQPFKDNEYGISHWENFLRNISSIKGKIYFLYVGNTKHIQMYAYIPHAYRQYFENSFYANYKTSELSIVPQNVIPTNQHYIHFSDKTTFATKQTFSRDGSYIDPSQDLLSIFNGISSNDQLTVCYTISYQKPSNRRQKIAKKLRTMSQILIPPPSSTKDEKEEEADSKEDRTDMYVQIGYHIRSADAPTRTHIHSNMKNVIRIFYTQGKCSIKYNTPKQHKLDRTEASHFFHIPTQQTHIPQLNYAVYRRLPAPINVATPLNTPQKELTIFGKTDYRGEPVQFGIRQEDKFRHVYIIGKTGTGKSTFLSNLIRSDIEAGNGIGLLDPHGELVETVLEHIPTNRINDVILFDVSDDEYPVGFNLLGYKTQDEKLRVVSGVVTTFKKLFGHSRGPRLEYILRNVMLTLIDYPNATLLHIMRILTDKEFRTEVLKFVKDSMIVNFWKNEFDQRNERKVQDAIGPITNKIGQFLSSSVVRNIFGQPRAKLSLRDAMDSGKIVLINLSKGKIGADNAAMIGSLLVTKFEIDAMARADQKKHERRPFYLYIDEFQNFATDSFATILSEARKYKLSIIVANQYTSQLDQGIRDAIFGNIGTIIAFTLGYDDANIISQQFKQLVSINDLLSLPRFTAYIRQMVDGVTSDPFSMKTLPLPTPDNHEELLKKIVQQSRQRYALPKHELEKLLEARGKKRFSAQEAVTQKAKREGQGIHPDVIKNLSDPHISQYKELFARYHIGGYAPDALLIDTNKKQHIAVRYTFRPAMSKAIVIHEDSKELTQTRTLAKHRSYLDESGAPLRILITRAHEAYLYLQQELQDTQRRKFLPNTAKKGGVHNTSIPPGDHSNQDNEKNKSNQKSSNNATPSSNKTSSTSKPRTTQKKSSTQQNATNAGSTKQKISVAVPGTRIGNEPAEPNLQQRQNYSPGGFSIDNIQLGKQYQGYVKLVYNYGIFVTVKGVEGLLHKSNIVSPSEDISWKKYYNIGDPITITAEDFTMVKGEKKVIRTQK